MQAAVTFVYLDTDPVLLHQLALCVELASTTMFLKAYNLAPRVLAAIVQEALALPACPTVMYVRLGTSLRTAQVHVSHAAQDIAPRLLLARHVMYVMAVILIIGRCILIC